MAPPKRMNFRKVPKGGGVIFNPQIYIADFGPLNRVICAENKEGLKAIWNFSPKIHPFWNHSFLAANLK